MRNRERYLVIALLTRTAVCPIQAFRHREHPVYGVQFHPERYDDDHPQGKQLLANFFAIALQSNPCGS